MASDGLIGKQVQVRCISPMHGVFAHGIGELLECSYFQGGGLFVTIKGKGGTRRAIYGGMFPIEITEVTEQ